MEYRKTVEVKDNLVSVKFLQDDSFICNIDFNKKELEKIGNRYDVDNNNFIGFATSDLEQAMFSVLYKAQEAIGLTEYKRNLDTSS
jgi:hypothetical protein